MKLLPFIVETVNEGKIDIEYLISGLEGLQEGKCGKKDFEDLCLNVIEKRSHNFNDINLSSFLRTSHYIVQRNKNLDKRIFEFIRRIMYKYPDRQFIYSISQKEDKGMDAITAGINSIRGIAVELMVECYELKQFEDEIFETLECVADNTSEITRSCVIFKGAWLSNLNENGTFDLYLKLLGDFNPHLLATPCHNGYPLLYLMHVDFKKLYPFFGKAVLVEEAREPMSMFLLNAYLHNLPRGYSLLKNLISINSTAKQELAWYVYACILKDERYSSKGWNITKLLLDFNDKELGEKINHCFLHIPAIINNNLITFLNKYVKSAVGKYRDNYFFDFLREIIPSDAYQALNCFLESKPEDFKQTFYEKSPINVLIESYNDIREYEKGGPLLERAIDVFDSLLRIQEYRNNHLRMFLRELSV